MSATAEKAPDKTEAEEEKKGGKKKLIIIAVLVLVLAGAAYWFFLTPKGPEPAPEPGEIVPMDATQINLAGGHYLRLGIALQLTTTAHEADGSKALDAAIEIFSGKSLEQLEGHRREALKEKLNKELEHLYHGDVMDVYFTEFVTQ
jgi:flagellar protein FliL